MWHKKLSTFPGETKARISHIQSIVQIFVSDYPSKEGCNNFFDISINNDDDAQEWSLVLLLSSVVAADLHHDLQPFKTQVEIMAMIFIMVMIIKRGLHFAQIALFCF